ncbi:MAG: SPOR domain-containing protein [Alloprevotella sp.]
MIRLSAHIVSLMLKHDCVIVPELGGFVAQYVPARLITAENILMPPCRTVVFNPRLNMNDGLLVQSYMQAYHTGYTETLRMVNAEVKKLKEILAKEGSYELSGIGTLCMQGTDKMLFTPQESGILSPELYGLNTVATMLPAEQKKKKRRRKTATLRRFTQPSFINREWVRYSVAVAAAIVFYFLLATPLSSPSTSQTDWASAVNQEMFRADNPALSQVATPVVAEKVATESVATDTLNQEKVTEENTETNVKETAVTSVKQEKTAETKVAQSETEVKKSHSETYTIVLACAVPRKSAEHFVEQLQKEGLHEAEIIKTSMLRVIYGNYSSQEEAYAQLRKLRSHNAFAEAWVMKKPK